MTLAFLSNLLTTVIVGHHCAKSELKM